MPERQSHLVSLKSSWSKSQNSVLTGEVEGLQRGKVTDCSDILLEDQADILSWITNDWREPNSERDRVAWFL